jgi:hypothetical protein
MLAIHRGVRREGLTWYGPGTEFLTWLTLPHSRPVRAETECLPGTRYFETVKCDDSYPVGDVQFELFVHGAPSAVL